MPMIRTYTGQTISIGPKSIWLCYDHVYNSNSSLATSSKNVVEALTAEFRVGSIFIVICIYYGFLIWNLDEPPAGRV